MCGCVCLCVCVCVFFQRLPSTDPREVLAAVKAADKSAALGFPPALANALSPDVCTPEAKGAVFADDTPPPAEEGWGPSPGEHFNDWRNSKQGKAKWASFTRGAGQARTPIPKAVADAILGNSEAVPRGDLFKIFLDCKGVLPSAF